MGRGPDGRGSVGLGESTVLGMDLLERRALSLSQATESRTGHKEQPC
jgi:hypothetical protein